MNRRQQLQGEATWHAQESRRLLDELATMTPGHKDAIGPQQVRRMEVDAETHQLLADEYTGHIARMDELEEAAAAAAREQAADVGLF